MAVQLRLAEAYVDVRADLSKLAADLSKVNSMLSGLGTGGGAGGGIAAAVAQGMASGMAQGVARGSGPAAVQMRNALGQFTSQGVAQGVTAGVTQGVAGARGAAAPLGQAVQQAVQQGFAAGAAQGAARWQGQARNAMGQFTAGPGGGARSGFGAAAGQGAMGFAQGLGIGGFAFSPGMMAGQMIGKGLKDSVSTAMDLESTFVDLQRVTGESADNIDRFKKTVFDIAAKQGGVSVGDVTGIATAGAKAGISDKEGLAGLETFSRSMAKVKNAVGGGEGLGTEQLTEDMTRMMYLFGKNTDYIESMGSAMVRMANISTASAGSIAQMTKALSGTTASLGLAFTDTAAFASVLADAGLTAQQGASSFSQIFRSMAAKPETFAGAAGVTVEKWSQMMNTGQLLPGFVLLAEKFKEINAVDPTRAQQWLKGLGFVGVRTAGAFQQVATLAGKIPERVAMAKEEETTKAALGAADVLKSGTTAAEVQKLKNAFTELGDALGSNLLKPISETAAAAAALTRSLAGVTPPAVSALQSAGGLASGLASPESNAKHLANAMVAIERNPAIMGRIKGAIDVAAGGMASMVLPSAAGTDVLGRGIARIMGTPEAGAPGPARPPGPDLRGDRAKALAAVAAENERRQAEAERLRRERFLPTAADRARALEEVGPAKVNAKGEVAKKDQKEHDEMVFRHAQRLQGERLGKDFGENIVQGGDAENNARVLGKKIAFFGQMALGAMIAAPEKKLETAAGLAGRGAGALVDAAGRPLAGAGKALAGLGPDEIDEKKLKEKKKIESQAFTDAAAYSTDAIQKALTGADKTPAEHLKAAKASEVHLREIKDALKPSRQKQGGGAPVFTNP